mmetsp:Transcript_75757/g.214150  ORF Transcript_75757/g.214150 Transcript_75757/m.214150 type:complete len:193 (+) Transcript_75757:104-682(+)
MSSGSSPFAGWLLCCCSTPLTAPDAAGGGDAPVRPKSGAVDDAGMDELPKSPVKAGPRPDRPRGSADGDGAPPQDTPAAPATEHRYEITLDKTAGTRLGMDVGSAKDGKDMVIAGFANGLVEEWNRLNPHCMVKVGDRIVQVNDCTGDAEKLIDECKKNMLLRVHLVRDPEVPVLDQLDQCMGQAPEDKIVD